MLSILSNIPPCPGNIFPKSFIPTVLFIAEAEKSPIWLSILKKTPIIAINQYCIFALVYLLTKKVKILF